MVLISALLVSHILAVSHTYIASPIPVSYSEAHDKCRGLNGWIPYASTYHELEDLKTEAKNAGIPSSYFIWAG